MKTNVFTFIGCDATYEEAKVVLFGAPFDSTVSFRPGTRFAPNSVREQSYGLETYSPALGCELNPQLVCDIGDLELPFGNTDKTLAMIRETVAQILQHNKLPVMIGGEHLVTLGAFQAVLVAHPTVEVIQFDAHADLRAEYLGEPLSHACVMRRCHDLIGDDRIHQFGIRSMSQDEACFAPNHVNQYELTYAAISQLVEQVGQTPIYLTVDLDVLDPSVFPGTGTPEPGGAQFQPLMTLLYALRNLNIVGLDVCELSPHYDTSHVSSITAAKVIRELLMMCQQAGGGNKSK